MIWGLNDIRFVEAYFADCTARGVNKFLVSRDLRQYIERFGKHITIGTAMPFVGSTNGC